MEGCVTHPCACPTIVTLYFLFSASFCSTVDMETAREVKERLCYVSSNFDPEAEVDKTKVTRSYTLPNGDVISVGEERFRCSEVLFQPSLIGEGLHLRV